MREFRKPFVTHFTYGVIFIKLFVKSYDCFKSKFRFVKGFLICLLLVCQCGFILLNQHPGKILFITKQKMCHLSKLCFNHFFKRISSDIMSSGTISTIIDFVVGRSKVVNIPVYGICMVTHFAVTVAAIYQSVKNTSFAVFLFVF